MECKQDDRIRKLDNMWQAHKIGTFVKTSTIQLAAVAGWLGLFTVLMLPDGKIALCLNESCSIVDPPVYRLKSNYEPGKLVYIAKGRFMGTYGRILGTLRRKLFLKPEKNTLGMFLQVAERYEKHVFIVSKAAVHVV